MIRRTAIGVARLFYKPLRVLLPSITSKISTAVGVWGTRRDQLRANHYGSCLGDEKANFLCSQIGKALHVEGDIIECGVFQGGSLLMIAEQCARQCSGKRIHALDSFEGFDPEEFEMDVKLGFIPSDIGNFRENSLTFVKTKARRLGLHRNIHFVKGYFNDTLSLRLNRVDSLCFAHIDCDLYEPVKFCAEQIFPKMSPGGILLFDDLATSYTGARQAFEEFTSTISCKQVTEECGMGMIVV
jgi:hypothetical protein